MHLRARLDLNPGELPEMHEDGGQAESRCSLLHDFAACAGVCIKAGADPRELRLEGVAGHQANTAFSQDRPGRLTGPVVGMVGRWAEKRAPGRTPDPVIDHYEHDPRHDHLDHEREPQAEQPGREGLEPSRHAEQPVVGEPREKRRRDGNQEPPEPPHDAAVGETGGHETGQARRIDQPVDAGEPW